MNGTKLARYMGKRKDNNEWITGYYVDGMICESAEDVSNAMGEYYGETPYVGFVDVYEETVSQYIGRKDKHSKMIFEGHKLDTGSCAGIVRWEDDKCRYVLCRSDLSDLIPLSYIPVEDCEIIGHVFDAWNGYCSQ